MENKINVAEILKDCPQGMELDCPMYDNLYFDCIREHAIYPIVCYTVDSEGEKYEITFHWYGKCALIDTAKCVIFPKGKTTWEGFQPPFKNGDIVVYDNPHRNNLQVFVFKNKEGNNTLSSCYLMLDGDELVLEEGMYYVTRLATEEEKQKLFDAIKANGYKWNAETKTLEKLVEPTFKVGDRIKNKNTGICDKVIKIFKDCYLVESCLDEQATIGFDIQDNWELAPNKFDINTLVPFESKVLVRDYETDKWSPAIWGFYDSCLYFPYIVVGGNEFKMCIPYEGNQELMGTTKDCEEFYKTWEV